MNQKLKNAVKKAVLEVCNKHGSVEPENIRVSTEGLEYEPQED